MTTIMSYSYHPTSAYDELTGVCSTVTTRGRPSPAYVEDDCLKVFLHGLVSVLMFGIFVILASGLWQQDRHDVIIAAIVFSYSTVMIHLVLIKRREEEKQRELEEREEISTPMRVEWAPMLMLVATGVMLISLVVTVFVFRTEWYDLAIIAFMASVSTVLMFAFLKVEEINRYKTYGAKL